ncbi:hypothetical protein [Pseudomonas putida]
MKLRKCILRGPSKKNEGAETQTDRSGLHQRAPEEVTLHTKKEMIERYAIISEYAKSLRLLNHDNLWI